jgi:predicted DNA-binding protein (MmcQ/YjbR family)
MDIESLRAHCIQKKDVTEEFPFDEVTLVFKVHGKIFLIVPLDEPDLRFTFKSEPEQGAELREKHPSVAPAWHMNKTHWNSVSVDGSVSDGELYSWIDHSYCQVVKGLPKKLRSAFESCID